MKVTEFQKEIGVNSRGFGSFMGQHGKFKGDKSNVYYNAFAFFKKRELQGVKPPKKAKISKEEEEKKFDVSAIKLDGESTTSVPVYDTCDEIRKKISAYLREPGVTQAAFLREIAKTYPEEKKIQPKILSDFLGKKRADRWKYEFCILCFLSQRGNGEAVGELWWCVDTKNSSSRRIWCHVSERAVEDNRTYYLPVFAFPLAFGLVSFSKLFAPGIIPPISCHYDVRHQDDAELDNTKLI
ncbi:hypothetical protein EYC84_007058 [Monilinia fructicola]|uniref:DUF7726 domain-containing protein n=1 Tax=Monilinia fructicola TaxID=38448 RepID=A0A5M9K5D7_MONFR|nr:hypothetical protein EYC84_007058 [Monilinia fructicola]